MHREVALITVGQDSEKLKPLRCTVERTRVPFEILPIAHYVGFMDKAKAVLEHLQKNIGSPHRFVVFTNGYDVVSTGCSERDLLDVFHHYGTEIIIGGENGWHRSETQPDMGAFFDVPVEHRHPNAGCFGGTVRALTGFIEAVIGVSDAVNYDEQAGFTKVIMERGGEFDISIDSAQMLCSNTFGHEQDVHVMITEEDPGHSAWYRDSFEEVGNRLVNVLTGFPTCFIHENSQRVTLPLGRSWWSHELARRCLGTPEAPSDKQLSFHTTPPHSGSRMSSAICPLGRCLRQHSWRGTGRPAKYAGGSNLGKLYKEHRKKSAAPRRKLFTIITYNADRARTPEWDASKFIAPLNCSVTRMGAGPISLVNLPSEEHELGPRMRHVFRWLKSQKFGTLVVYLDAWDVVMMGPPREVVSKFRSFNTKILVSADRYFWPHDCDPVAYYPAAVPGAASRFANSGGFMGLVEDLLTAFKEMGGPDGEFQCPDVCGNAHSDTDDMRCFHWLWAQHTGDDFVRVDHNSSVFFSMDKMDMGSLRRMPSAPGGPLRYEFTTTNERPCFLHANGNGKEKPRVEVFREAYSDCFLALPQFYVHRSQLREV